MTKDDDERSVPTGRLTRLGKVVGLTARAGKDLLRAKLQKKLGGSEDAKLDAARSVLETLGEMKGAALKLGQTLSLGAGHLPPEMRELVSRLFSQAPALPFTEIRAAVEAELGAPLEQRFATFDNEPFAAASLGQVHSATLPTG